jgi:molybdate transport system ATP-binding protein
VKFIKLDNFSGCLDNHTKHGYTLKNVNWQVNEGEHWLLAGGNGAGKSALSAALVGIAQLMSGSRYSAFERLVIVSSNAQKHLLNKEIANESTTLARDFLLADPAIDKVLSKQLIHIFNFEHVLNRHFRALSTGETRKLLLIKALSSRPQLVVLDEPFDGLDSTSSEQLHLLLIELAKHTTFVFVLNRLEDAPEFISHLTYVSNGELLHTLVYPSFEQRADFAKLLHLKHTQFDIPKPHLEHTSIAFSADQLVKLTSAKVSYGDHTIFKNLDWCIKKHVHWQLSGKNGSGKTCLLNLITGDNPQCYSNDIKVFGFTRGTGESIWDIKQHIGYISNALHMDYRVSTSALNTILSGFYDSIGLYQNASDDQRLVALQWLALIGLTEKKNTPFTALSYGDQRMLLIARAMVKHPTLLILDEPCLGLDEANRQRVLLLIEKICAAKSSTVIYVNHHSGDKIKGINNYLSMDDFS